METNHTRLIINKEGKTLKTRVVLGQQVEYLYRLKALFNIATLKYGKEIEDTRHNKLTRNRSRL